MCKSQITIVNTVSTIVKFVNPSHHISKQFRKKNKTLRSYLLLYNKIYSIGKSNQDEPKSCNECSQL